jgi:DNA-directed RNA polymerase alpha subunit
MPSKNSYPVLITDFEELLAAVDLTPNLQPSIEVERQALAQFLVEIQSLRARQAELTALKQQATQQLKAVIEKTKEAAVKVRSMVKAKIGPKDEVLVHFKVAPQRKRPRKAKQEVKEPNGENPGTQQSTPASPPEKAVV